MHAPVRAQRLAESEGGADSVAARVAAGLTEASGIRSSNACAIYDVGVISGLNRRRRRRGRQTTLEQTPDAEFGSDTASGSWMVRVFRQETPSTCSSWNGRTGDARLPVTARDHVLLLHDLEELAKLHFPKSEQAAALRDGRLAGHCVGQLVLTTRGDGRRSDREPSLQVPEV